ncbi:Telomeric DNA-binding factor trf1, partial [Bienertia sinuspersici]
MFKKINAAAYFSLWKCVADEAHLERIQGQLQHDPFSSSLDQEEKMPYKIGENGLMLSRNYYTKNPGFNGEKGITPCELALSDPSYRFVASGKVHNFSTGTRVHTNPIPDGYVRVNIDYAIEENTPLPIPIEGECYVINDAIGTLVLWPTKLVVLEKTVANSLRNQDEHGDIIIKTPLSVLPEIFMFYKCIMKMDCSEQIIIPVDIGITTQNKTVHVGKEEILQFLAHEQIGVCHILIYMTKMYEYASLTGVSSLFGFLCPSGISLMTQHQKGDVKKVKENRRNRSRYLLDVFKENGLKGKVFFAPYNDGSHWILCVIDPYNNIVYYLDSLHNQEDIGTGKGKAEDGHKMDNNT